MPVSESTLRRRAAKRGWRLHKSRWRRDSIDNYGGWMIVDGWSNAVVAGHRFDLDDKDVEGWLDDSD